jgi:hypothetical protein
MIINSQKMKYHIIYRFLSDEFYGYERIPTFSFLFVGLRLQSVGDEGVVEIKYALIVKITKLLALFPMQVM